MTENIDLPPIPNKNFFSIGEVSRIVQLPAYVLRYWESQFNCLKPMRRNSGQRKYMRKDIETICQVKELLHHKKFTIAGAKKYLHGSRKKNEETVTLNAELGESKPTADLTVLKDIKHELQEILKLLKK